MAAYLRSSPEAESMIKHIMFEKHTRTVNIQLKRAVQHLQPAIDTANTAPNTTTITTTTAASVPAAAAAPTATPLTSQEAGAAPPIAPTPSQQDLDDNQDALRVAHFHVGIMVARMFIPCADSMETFSAQANHIIRLAHEFRAALARVQACVGNGEAPEPDQALDHAGEDVPEIMDLYNKDAGLWIDCLHGMMKKQRGAAPADMSIDVCVDIGDKVGNGDGAKDGNKQSGASSGDGFGAGHRHWGIAAFITALLFALAFGTAAVGLSLLAHRGEGSTVHGGGVSSEAGLVAQNTAVPVSAPVRLNPELFFEADSLERLEDSPQPSPPF